MILYYSACGNSRYVAKSLAQELGQELKFIPDLVDSQEYSVECEGDMLGFVFPVYGWNVPTNVYDYLSRIQISGSPSYLWFACTCGDNIGKTCEMFRKALKAKGLHLDAAFTFQMPETYLCFPGFKLDTEDGEAEKIRLVREKLPIVAEHIRNRDRIEDLITGEHPGFKTHIIGSLFNLLVSDKSFHTTDECVGCGLCERVCHFHNITIETDSQGNRRPRWKGHCTQCMACYHYCPKNAIQYGKMTQGKGQYHFPDAK